MVLPRIISCVGMPRSGSTWIYNAVLAAAKTSGKARGSFSDDFPEDLASFAREDVQLVLKSHEPTGRLISLLDILDAPVVLTVRDPRDCIVSMMQAFGFDFEQSTRCIRDSSIALGQLKDFAKAKTVKYENCVDRMAVLQDLYAFLDLDIEASAAANIFESLTSEAVERSISEMIEQGALDEDQPAGSWTEETHWHPNHIGDGATGKFVQHLDQAQSDYVISLNPDFFAALGYTREPPPSATLREEIVFSGAGATYLERGFAFPESWGAWTLGERARIELPVELGGGKVRIEFKMQISNSFRHAGSSSRARIVVNNEEVCVLEARPDQSVDLLVVYTFDGRGVEKLTIDIQCEGLLSPQDMGISTDDRLVGLGVRSLRLMAAA